MERLRISNNKRYFIKDSGEPFIWIADTAWTLPQRMKWDDVEYYMKKRKSQGFTVLQIVALDPERDVEMRNPAGEKALIGGDLSRPNEMYFRYLDWIIDKAEEYGLYILLLPVWGQLVVGEDWSGGIYEKTVTEENAFEYGCWIGKRYAKKNHILWCLGGDRQPIHRQKSDYRKVWRLLAEGLVKGVTGQTAKYNEKHPAWKELLITYHACYEQETGECSTFSYWNDEEAWIRFIMLQSGHGTTVKNYELVKKEYERENTMPVWDGEPGYEAMPTCWPITDESSFHDASVVRKRAYWSLLAGAFGYTYGHCNVWCTISEKEKNIISKTDWFEAMSSTASGQIIYLHSAMEALELYRCSPCQEILLEQSEREEPIDEHIQAAVVCGGTALCIYFPSGGKETLDIQMFDGEKQEFYGWWYNTRDGKFYTPEFVICEEPVIYWTQDHKLKVTAPEKELNHDWLFILQKEPGEKPIIQKKATLENKVEDLKKVFEW